MKIELLKNTVCDRQFFAKGQVIDASDADGQFLIDIGRAVLIEGKARDDSGVMKSEAAPDNPPPPPPPAKRGRPKGPVKRKKDAAA